MHKCDYIECPHCHYTDTEYHEAVGDDKGGEIEHKCRNCGGEMTIDFYSIFWFEAKKK